MLQSSVTRITVHMGSKGDINIHRHTAPNGAVFWRVEWEGLYLTRAALAWRERNPSGDITQTGHFDHSPDGWSNFSSFEEALRACGAQTPNEVYLDALVALRDIVAARAALDAAFTVDLSRQTANDAEKNVWDAHAAFSRSVSRAFEVVRALSPPASAAIGRDVGA